MLYSLYLNIIIPQGYIFYSDYVYKGKKQHSALEKFKEPAWGIKLDKQNRRREPELTIYTGEGREIIADSSCFRMQRESSF